MGSIELAIDSFSEEFDSVNFIAGENVVFDRVYSKEGLTAYLPLPFELNSQEIAIRFEEEMSNEFLILCEIRNNKVLVSGLDTYDLVNQQMYEIDDSDVFEGYIKSNMATHLILDTSIDQPDMEIIYHGREVFGELFVSEPDAVFGGDWQRDYYKIIVPPAMLDSEINGVNDRNLISVGNPCDNEITAAIKGVSSNYPECLEGYYEGKAEIKLYDTGFGKKAIVVAGKTELDTRRAAIVLANFEDYELHGYDVCVSGTSLSDIVISEGSCSEICWDTDGGQNKYVKGIVNGPLSNVGHWTYEDKCKTADENFAPSFIELSPDISPEDVGVEEGQCGVLQGENYVEVGLMKGTHMVPGPNWQICPYGCTDGACLKVKVDEQDYLEGSITGKKEVNIEFEEKSVVKFKHDFDKNELEKNIQIKVQDKESEKGGTLIKGIELEEEETKTIFVDDISESITTLCLKDAEIDELSEISDDCSGEEEYLISCPGEIATYNCTIEEGRYKIEGLKHSGAVEQAPVNDGENSQSNEGGNTQRAPRQVGSSGCAPTWVCNEWSACTNGEQTRTCTDKWNCAKGTSTEKQSCIVKTVKPKTQKPQQVVQQVVDTPRPTEPIYHPEPEEEDPSYWWVYTILAVLIVGGIIYLIYFLMHKNYNTMPEDIHKKIHGKALTEMKKSVEGLVAKGFSKEEIKLVLKKKGWEESVIEKIIK
jgi:hypothetical protein